MGGSGKNGRDPLIHFAQRRYLCAVECKEFDIIPLREWTGHHGILVMAGPCSAESEDQVIRTAIELKATGKVDILRAGIWKPRTRPSTFEGKGNEALLWLVKAREVSGLKIAVEVGTTAHVDEALRMGVDVLWLGARTTVNPFLVSEIAQALKGAPVAVMVKNPVNPDLQLWIGALERIYQTGIRRLAAIHRGFYFFRKSPWRNAPMWEIPIELKRICPRLPVIVDPSHICGKSALIPDIAQKALDLEMDGLMLEVHPDPVNALTDREQQITPSELSGLLGSLIIREKTPGPLAEDTLDRLRLEIDKLDQELIEILARRMTIIDEIGTYKQVNKITILQIRRWREMLAERLEKGIESGLNPEFLKQMLQLVHDESIRRQQDILNTHHQAGTPE